VHHSAAEADESGQESQRGDTDDNERGLIRTTHLSPLGARRLRLL
jgi:hypothetical protein